MPRRLLLTSTAFLTAVVATSAIPRSAHATCMTTCTGTPVFADCSAPDPACWPSDVPLSFKIACETCCSPPGGPVTCEPSAPDLGTMSLLQDSAPVSVTFTDSGALCDGDMRVFVSPALEPGIYDLVSSSMIVFTVTIGTCGSADGDAGGDAGDDAAPDVIEDADVDEADADLPDVEDAMPDVEEDVAPDVEEDAPADVEPDDAGVDEGPDVPEDVAAEDAAEPDDAEDAEFRDDHVSPDDSGWTDDGDGGCSCRAARSSGHGAPVTLIFGLLVAIASRRRRSP